MRRYIADPHHYLNDPDHYLNTPAFLRAQQWRRTLRTLYLDIKGIEPRAKHVMPDNDKNLIQSQVLGYLVKHRRRAFQGPVAVRVELQTTEESPAHLHTITKNLLDLLGRPRAGLPTRRRGLVYYDDAQVNALSVTCRHGQSSCSISVTVSRLQDLLDGLELAWDSTDSLEDPYDWDRNFEIDMAGEYLADLRHDEQLLRTTLGDDKYESLERFTRQRMQEAGLGRGGLTPQDIAMMFNLPGRGSGFDSSQIWDEPFASDMLRIRLSELPQNHGESKVWKNEIDAKLQAFRKQFRWLVDPLIVPVALEVVIRPPPPSREKNVHDLDNVLRKYLLPRAVETLKPLSHYSFTVGDDTKERPPASTKFGVSRYEAWRLPPAPEGSEGFVSLEIVTDMTGDNDVIRRIQRVIGQWEDSLD